MHGGYDCKWQHTYRKSEGKKGGNIATSVYVHVIERQRKLKQRKRKNEIDPGLHL